jgi:ubiquitin-protein ligase/Ran GTPase-activating protein (RanGAP) involved in mRNA processing and transport
MNRQESKNINRGSRIARGVPAQGRGRGGRGGHDVGRVARNQAKKYQERAKISTFITLNKSFAMKRLIKDLNEINNQVVPIVGVTAAPLEDSIFEWHGNIKASSSSVYRGGVLHLSFTFPENYPVSPPVIKILNENIQHPCLGPGGKITLDMLEIASKKTQFRGWTSAYSVLSVLIQLQSFFFEADEVYLDEEKKKTLANVAREMNEFSCSHPDCKHKGSANPWPEFIKGDNDPNNHKMTEVAYQQSLKNEIVCYHRKTTFEEAPLGIGVNIVKIPRTGDIKSVVPIMDFVSLKAYMKEKIRKSSHGERFSHWFPLYFGIKDQQFLKLSTKAISMIVTGSTRKFSHEMVIKVIPKFFNSIITDVMSEKTVLSCRALKILIYIYRVILMLMKVFPQVCDEIEQNVFKFINDKNSRVKDQTPSLGDLLCYVTLSKKFKLEDLLIPYVEEQLDRQIFWIIQLLPELENLLTSSAIDDVKSKVCFKAGIVGNQILLFYFYFMKKIVMKDTTSFDDIAKKLDSNFGNLQESEIENHHKEIVKILKIDSYSEYYKFINLTPPSDNEMNEKIKQAFKNSADKGYHGSDLIRFVPSNQEQIKMFFDKYPVIEKLLDNEGNLLPDCDPIWEALVIEKFEEVNLLRLRTVGKNLTVYDVALDNENSKYKYLFINETEKFNNTSFIQKLQGNYQINVTRDDDSLLRSLTWRTLYIKLFVEKFIKYFNYSADFKYLYQILDKFSPFIQHINLYIYQITDLKSDYNYLRAILTKLTNLKQLNMLFLESGNIKLIKNLIKGVNNFVSNGGKLDNLNIFLNKDCSLYTHKDFNMLSMIDKLNQLKVLDLSNTSLDINTSLRIRNHLYYFKTIEVLIMENCNLNDNMAKEIADGIMKAKSLEKINLRRNYMTAGLANILYNLAFQPSLKYVNISDNSSLNLNETSSSLYKLIKMSQSLETLIVRNVSGLLQVLSKTNDFFYSLGDNSSLKYLDFTNSGTFSDSSLKLLGSAVAFNHKKNGSLSSLFISKTQLNYSMINTFIENMCVSEETHFQWYGSNFNTNIVKDSKEYYEKHFFCKLNVLEIGDSDLKTSININDLKNNPKNIFSFLLQNNSNLEVLNLSNCSINKNFVEILANALCQKNSIRSLIISNSNFNGELVKIFFSNLIKDNAINTNFNLNHLDLSKNKFGYSGIDAISEFLKLDNSLKSLNLYNNRFDVDGARKLAKALLLNKTLEYLDVGYNRIKDLGFVEVTNAIMMNLSSNIKFLGSRYNLIKNKTGNFLSNLEKVSININIDIEI